MKPGVKKTVRPSRRPKRQGILFILIGPSQVGKDTILKRLLKMRSLKLHHVVTCTTRAPRPGEVPGKTYHYVSDAAFDEMRRRGDLLEWVHIQTHRSGTPKYPLFTWLKRGEDALQHMDVKGADVFMKRKDMRVVTIFVLPKSVEELHKRFSRRSFSPRERAVRWKTTLGELAQQDKYDFRVINAEGELDAAVHEVAEIIRSVR